MRALRTVIAMVVVLGALLAPAAASALDPLYEARNFGKGAERQAIYSTPEYQALLRAQSARNLAAATAIQAADPERQFSTTLCASGMDGCAGDVRLYDWKAAGYGLAEPVTFTARSGATLSGHVWATRSGPSRRPGIVITNGSVQAAEQLYWFAAQALAKAGYVVLTFDPQGQGQSDVPGAGADSTEGVPAQSDGRPFFDGTADALDFMLSTPEHPYLPRPSCSSATNHADKQQRRVAAGLATAANPLAGMLDAGRIGLAGHSFGASGVSYVAQRDPRVKAVVAWDNLGPADADRVEGCADAAERAPAPVTKPGLGISADYFIPPTPNTSDPDPAAKAAQSRAYSQAGVDTGEVVIRGGTHFDFDWIPNPAFTATLRGADLIDWYTTAWFDKYVKGDPTADRRLLTDRWRADERSAAVDPDGDANTLSRYYRSRLDIGRSGGGRVVCEDLRRGCPELSADDGVAGTYDYVELVTSPDGADVPGVDTTPSGPEVTGAQPTAGAAGTPGGGGTPAPGAAGTASSSSATPSTTTAAPPSSALNVRRCVSRRRLLLHAHHRAGLRVRQVTATISGHRVARARGRQVAVTLAGRDRQRVRVVLTVVGRRDGRTVRLREVRTFRTCTARDR